MELNTCQWVWENRNGQSWKTDLSTDRENKRGKGMGAILVDFLEGEMACEKTDVYGIPIEKKGVG